MHVLEETTVYNLSLGVLLGDTKSRSPEELLRHTVKEAGRWDRITTTVHRLCVDQREAGNRSSSLYSVAMLVGPAEQGCLTSATWWLSPQVL